MKTLKDLLKSQHCKLVAVNKTKTSFAFIMPDKKTRVSVTLPRPANEATEKELAIHIANSMTGSHKQ